MQTHQLQRNTERKMARQVGRGGKRGKTSGRGTKGMLARSGYKRRPEMRDIIKKLPKLRGYDFKGFQTRVVPISLDMISAVFKDGAKVNQASLYAHGMIKKTSGKYPRVKILADGELTKKVTISGIPTSASAKAKIEKAGGMVK